MARKEFRVEGKQRQRGRKELVVGLDKEEIRQEKKVKGV